MHINKSERKLLPMSRIAPGRNDAAEIDTVVSAKRYGDRRAFDILMEAQYYWSQMDDFRKDRERNKRYTYGFQWDDMICVDGKSMSEEEYIKSQGNVPLKTTLSVGLCEACLACIEAKVKNRPVPHVIGMNRNLVKR